MPITPKQVQEKLDKFYDNVYIKGLEEIAKEFFDQRIVPYCQKHQLSFTMMNGLPRFVDQGNNYVSLPRFMQNIVDISDREGNRLMWHMPDYKHQPAVDFNTADSKFWNKRAEHVKEQVGEDNMLLYFAFSI